MASWSGFLAASGFRLEGQKRRIDGAPRMKTEDFRSFWREVSVWGTFAMSCSQFSITPAAGFLQIREIELASRQKQREVRVETDTELVTHRTLSPRNIPVPPREIAAEQARRKRDEVLQTTQRSSKPNTAPESIH